MEPRKKRLLPFYVISTIIFFFLLFNIFWTITLDKGSSLRQIIFLIDTTLMFSLFIIGLVGYVIDKKFELADEDSEEKRKIFGEFSKFEKFTTILTICGCIIMSLSILIGEYLLFLLGPNIITNVFIILEYVGIGLIVIGGVLILK
ncbi:MAG: hypothetical protein ACFFHD_12655 [Promethearchaeota archaeon]